MARIKRDRPWSEYPIGTKAYCVHGGHWIRVERGWKWFTGDTFPTPGADAFDVELPAPPAPRQGGGRVMNNYMGKLSNTTYDSIVEAVENAICDGIGAQEFISLIREAWAVELSDKAKRDDRVFYKERGT